MSRRSKTITVLVIIAVQCFLMSCDKILPGAPEDSDILDGPIEGLTGEQHALFLKGDAAFNNEIFTPAKGLGPIFVSTSCGSCHAGDGRGHPFTSLTRFGQADISGNTYLEQGGPQLQNHSISGFIPETIPDGVVFSKFLPPANTGLGLLEAVSDVDLLAMEDPNDEDGDGISGVVNWVTAPDYYQAENHVSQDGKYIGRFGRKGAAVNLMHQTVNAYIQDMGITSEYHIDDLYHTANGNFGTDNVADPEVSGATLNSVVFYLQTLKPPVPRHKGDAEVQNGKELFNVLQCTACHVPELQTGSSPIAALSMKTFYPYTDMLLHDMGSGLDDGYTEGNAETWEWKTPPLWGLGLSMNSQGGEYFLMHDGRAHSIEEAILLHGGEGEASKTAFSQLPEQEKNTLIKFLESL